MRFRSKYESRCVILPPPNGGGVESLTYIEVYIDEAFPNCAKLIQIELEKKEVKVMEKLLI